MPTALLAVLWLSFAPVALAAPGPTLAKEDTLYTQLPELLVSAPRVTLDEILDRIARGEVPSGSKPPELLTEVVSQVYKKRPDRVRSFPLRQWQRESQKKSARVEVNFSPGMSEEIVNFAFRPEARRDFRYRILGREIKGNHLIYRIRFEPKSPLDPTEPDGVVWVDTNDFVIVRQEINFARSPVPLILKGVERMVVERQRVNDHWVLRRVLLRALGTIPLPKLGNRFDVSILFDQYAINTGLTDSLFTAKGPRP
jgi:hypothetical protein